MAQWLALVNPVMILWGPLKARNFFVRFQVLTAMSMKITVFWDIAPR
jgi:hypothetical protein